MILASLRKPLQKGQTAFQGRYQLEKMLGRGGMGYVWLTHDLELDVHRALKFVTGVYEEAAVEFGRLRQEAALTHTNIVRTYDFVRDKQHAALSMEYIDGITWKQYQQCQPGNCFKVVEIRHWIEQLCHALAYAHARGIVHLDLKPANIMISRCGRLKVADFGISQSLKEPAKSFDTQPSGTPAYMSPQQRAHEPSTIEDDIYAFGATLYHLLSGQKPTADSYRREQLVSKARMEQGATRRGSIPMNWERVIRACLDPDPGKRPHAIVDVAKHLGFNIALFADETNIPQSDPGILRAQSELSRNEWADDLEPTVVDAPPRLGAA
ncbi:MAG: serine/threonine protein kinase [Verrucomicrobiales bacterium]|jgi:serine/threonine protein kinase